MIKVATTHFNKTNEKEVRIICKQDSREARPQVFIENNLFLLPVKNGQYAILKGEGYVDIPAVNRDIEEYNSKLGFTLETSLIGNSEMQQLDYAYATSLLRTFLNDETLVLTIRGRKYTPQFDFFVGGKKLLVESVQTEVDAGYEGRDQVALIEAKNSSTSNIIIRHLFYPYRQWQHHTQKKVNTLFFEKRENIFSIWQFEFNDPNDYNSIQLTKCSRYKIV